MQHKQAAVRVGAFVLSALVLFAAILFFLEGSALNQGTPYETYFHESVQGLDVGSPVKYRGVTIGKITDIGLVSTEYPPPSAAAMQESVWRQVVVRFKIDYRKLGNVRSVEQAIKYGLRVQIAPQGITGLSYLELSFVKPGKYPAESVPWTPHSTVIPTIPSTLMQVQDAAESVLSKLNKLDLSDTMQTANTLLHSLNNTANSPELRQVLTNANTLLETLTSQLRAAQIPATTADLRTLASGPRTQQILANLNIAAKNLATASAALPKLAKSGQSTAARASETLADLQQQLATALENLNAVTQNLRALSATLSRNPGAVLSAPPPRDQP